MRTTHRRRLAVAISLIGLVLGILGLAGSPASAEHDEGCEPAVQIATLDNEFDCEPDPCDILEIDVLARLDEQVPECDWCPNLPGIQPIESDCTTPPPPPVVVLTPVPDATVVDCAGPNGAPGILVTLRNTGDGDAVFDIVIDGAHVGDPQSLTVTPAEGTETLTFPQSEDEGLFAEITSGSFSLATTLDGDCAEEPAPEVLPTVIEAPTTTTTPPAEVLGVTQTRVLARTGFSNGALLVAAGLLLLAGGTCLFGSTLPALARRR